MNSPPQQKPTAPIAETPLFFKASITGFASSIVLSWQYKNKSSEAKSINNASTLENSISTFKTPQFKILVYFLSEYVETTWSSKPYKV